MRALRVFLGSLVVLMVAAGSRGEEPTSAPAASPSPGLTFSLGVDWTSAYIFRGIPQENQGAIVQPYAGMGVRLGEGSGSVGPTYLNFNIWTSLHSGPTGHGHDPSNVYELDLSVGLSTSIAENWTIGLTYIAYTSPNGSYNTVHELDLFVALDDTKWLGGWAMHPHMVVAAELANQADAGNSAFVSHGTARGVYLELGIAPLIALTDKKLDGPFITLPVTAGFSLANYYENAPGHSDLFGYLDAGADLIVPLGKTGGAAWTLKVGPHVIYLGNNASEIGSGVTGGDDTLIYGRIGISAAF